jgi:hypothetical protein
MSNPFTYPGLQAGGKERHPDLALARNNIFANQVELLFRAKALTYNASSPPRPKARGN